MYAEDRRKVPYHAACEHGELESSCPACKAQADADYWREQFTDLAYSAHQAREHLLNDTLDRNVRVCAAYLDDASEIIKATGVLDP